MNDHTPGPWFIEPMPSKDCDSGWAETHITANANKYGREGSSLAVVNRWATEYDGPAKGASEANARLIAAAPDMYNLIKMVLETTGHTFINHKHMAEEIMSWIEVPQ